MSEQTEAQVSADLPFATFYLQTDGERAVVHKEVIDGFVPVGESVVACGFYHAKVALKPRMDDLQKIIAAVREGARELWGDVDDQHDEALSSLDGTFGSVPEALRFAMQYAGQHSPATPLSRMVKGSGIGRGRGLVGVDAAGQAGMILGSLDRALNAEQKAVLMVRFGAAVQEGCPCCGMIGHPRWWMDAVSVLSLTPELRDLPKPIREAVVMKTVGRQKVRVQAKADGYEVTERQIRRRVSSAKDHFGRIENAAIGVLQDHFSFEKR